MSRSTTKMVKVKVKNKCNVIYSYLFLHVKINCRPTLGLSADYSLEWYSMYRNAKICRMNVINKWTTAV